MPTSTSNALSGNGFDKVLFQELANLEGIQHQDPETGRGLEGEKTTYVSQYTNRIFGAPFQLIDSVDRRFPSVNRHVGNEYLRNFILNSPILHIKPGIAKYTGGTDSSALLQSIKEIYVGTSQSNMTNVEALLTELAGGTVFSKGSKLQKRMFGFRENFHQYMSYVNYMCRSMATFLNISADNDGQRFPVGTWTNSPKKNGFEAFYEIKWENYRMLTSSQPTSPLKQLESMGRATLLGAGISTSGAALKNTLAMAGHDAGAIGRAAAGLLNGDDSALNQLGTALSNNARNAANATGLTMNKAFSKAESDSVIDIICDKISSVMFMVEPVSFEETITNQTKDSAIETALDAATDAIGSEIAFITNSQADTGIVDNIASFLGDTVSTAANFLSGLVEPATGGFTTNLFNGALSSIKGQKMIYPKIYSKSESHQDYQFTINLSTPYGDVYNYYMNIVVPLMHLIALAAPRMMTANSVASPFMVQAFIPGQCTCQLGIISNMQIIKNPDVKHVSVQGYPLDVQVKITVEELYNSLSISPANDPASFLFNETLNDYMANLAGLMPSVNTYSNQRKNAFKNLAQYFNGEEGDFAQDIANSVLMRAEDFVNPYSGR